MDKIRSDVVEEMLKRLSGIEYISPDEVPNIALYMDQVTTFMDAQLCASKRHPEDKILTKTMINNYTKNNLLPPPVKKKYSPEHMLLLIFIYYLKSFLSITDIQQLLTPLTQRYFSAKGEVTLEKIYQEIVSIERKQKKVVKTDIEAKLQYASECFADFGEKDRDFLSLYALISMLSFDIYAKKQMIERIIDSMSDEEKEQHEKKEKAEKKDKNQSK